MKILIVAVLFASLLDARATHPLTLQAAPSTPANSDAEKAEIIRKIVQASDTPDLHERMANLLMPAQNARLRLDRVYPAGYVLELRTKLKENLTRFNLGQLLSSFYDRNFSVGELNDILAFRTSATGRKVAGLEWELYSEVNAAITQWARDTAPALNQEILAEHPEYAKQIAENKHNLEAERAAAENLGPTGEYSGPVESAGNGVSAPRVASKTEPHYSKEAQAAGLQGTVLLSVIIDEHGMPRNIRVVRPLGKGLDEKAIEAVRHWRFKPGMKNGVPVAVRANIEVSFRLLQSP